MDLFVGNCGGFFGLTLKLKSLQNNVLPSVVRVLDTGPDTSNTFQ